MFVYLPGLFCLPLLPLSLSRTARVLLVADPQITNERDFNTDCNDLYYAHLFRNSLFFLRPGAVVLLGDLFAVHNSVAELDWMLGRHLASFPRSHGLPVVYLAGNHDIGYGQEAFASPAGRRIVEWWESNFGSVAGSVTEVAGHRLVAVNSLALDDAKEGEAWKDAWALVEGVARATIEGDMRPVILITHIPLHKPAGACTDAPMLRLAADGKVLEQNHLSPATSERLIDRLRPVLIISGHDHDGCVYRHKDPVGGQVTELTARSILGDSGGFVHVLTIESDGDAPTGAKLHVTSCGYVKMVTAAILVIADMIAISLAAVVFGLYKIATNARPNSRTMPKFE